jgi:hypothetical protein
VGGRLVEENGEHDARVVSRLRYVVGIHRWRA